MTKNDIKNDSQISFIDIDETPPQIAASQVTYKKWQKLIKNDKKLSKNDSQISFIDIDETPPQIAASQVTYKK